MTAIDKKESILQAAFKLFSSKGFYNTKMVDIAELAGIGKGTIYEYFSSKDALYIEFIKEKFLSFYKSADTLFSEDLNASEKLQEFIHFESKHIAANGKFFYDFEHNMNGFEKKCIGSDIHQAFFEMQHRRFSIVKRILEEGIQRKEFKQINPSTAALAVLGSLTAFLVFNSKIHPLSNKIVEGEIDINEFMELILFGLTHV